MSSDLQLTLLTRFNLSIGLVIVSSMSAQPAGRRTTGSTLVSRCFFHLRAGKACLDLSMQRVEIRVYTSAQLADIAQQALGREHNSPDLEPMQCKHCANAAT